MTDQTDTIEPVLVIRPVATYPDSVTLIGTGIRDGLPAWIYDDYDRATPRGVRSAVLYTATGANDLSGVIALMLDCDAAERLNAIPFVSRHDVEILRDQAHNHARSTWTTYLDGISL